MPLIDWNRLCWRDAVAFGLAVRGLLVLLSLILLLALLLA